MEQATQILSSDSGQVFLPASVTLAFQRMHQTWRMLVLVGLGMLASVVVVCAVPLYAQVAMTAGLRSALTANSQSTDIVVRGIAYAVPSNTIARMTGSLNQEFQHNLGPYLLPEQFSFQTSPFNILVPAAHGTLAVSGDEMEMTGTNTALAAAHVHLTQGRMPGSTIHGNTIEVAIRAELAANLGWGPGTVIPVRVIYSAANNTPRLGMFKLQIVGVFAPLKNDDPFWHGENFLGFAAPNGNNFVADSLASNAALISLFSQPLAGTQSAITAASALVWYYSLNASHIQISQVDPILNAIQTVQVDNANNTLLNGTTSFQHLQTYLPSSALSLYHDRLPIVQFPVASLTLLVLCLALFFVTLMTGILVERQAGAIAILRSRGASGRQIFWSLVTQAVLPGLISLVIGPLLAISVVRLLAEHILTVADLGALNIVAGNPLPSALSVGLYALATAGAMVLTTILAIWSTARRDVLALRRETARSTRRPLWQRLRLDIVAAVIALAGYAASFYLLSSNTLDSQLYLLLLSPLALLQTLFLLLATLLVLFRFYPQVLRLGTKLVERRRSAAPILALAQIARAPRQPARVTMLLALACAFAIFALVFTASQAQRVQDVAGYQAGADFSGTIPVPVYAVQDLQRVTQVYNHKPGVLATSLGFIHQGQAGASLDLPVAFQAVDASAFAQAATWSTQDSSQPLTSLMQQLLTQSNADSTQNSVPAIVDVNTWNTLHLSQGATFTLRFPDIEIDSLLTLRVMAEVQHIPTSGNSALPGVLVDYSAFARIYTGHGNTVSNTDIALNYAWLSTRGDARSLASVRSLLSKGEMRLTPLYDRRAIEAALYADPIYLTLIGELELGAITALFLALLGCLVASWLSTRSRLTSFVTLRALGATPRQVVSTLAWEQSIIYTAALLLGILTGSLLAALSLPELVLTSVLPSQITGNVSNANFYAAQFVPPLQVIIPGTLWLVLGALIAICLLVLSLMVLKIARSSIGLVLRLSED